MKKVWLLATVLLLTLTIATISCFGGSNGDDDDDNNNDNDGDDLGACCNSENQCSVTDRLDCTDDGGRWLGAETLCIPDPCNGDDDDDDDECEGNTAPTTTLNCWNVNGIKEEFNNNDTATTEDIIGFLFEYDDAECNLNGGYATVVLTVDGVEQDLVELGPYTGDDIGCSSDQTGKGLGFTFENCLHVGDYSFVWTLIDACGALSNEVTVAFTITE